LLKTAPLERCAASPLGPIYSSNFKPHHNESHGAIPMAGQFRLSDGELRRCGKLLDNPTGGRACRRDLVGILLSQNRYTVADMAHNLHVTERTIFDDLAKIKNPDYQPPKQWGGTPFWQLQK
jgi:hypothetical protein